MALVGFIERTQIVERKMEGRKGGQAMRIFRAILRGKKAWRAELFRTIGRGLDDVRPIIKAKGDRPRLRQGRRGRRPKNRPRCFFRAHGTPKARGPESSSGPVPGD